MSIFEEYGAFKIYRIIRIYQSLEKALTNQTAWIGKQIWASLFPFSTKAIFLHYVPILIAKSFHNRGPYM